jgi:3-hydroxyisobutyrate dehydrogenase-like beta-hydroxyacid dehydrogenase
VAVLALVGFGELGSALAGQLARSGAHEVRVHVRPRADPAAGERLERRIAQAGARRCNSLEDALAGAEAVVSVVPAKDAPGIVERCAPLLARGACYVDLSSSPVVEKEAGAELVAGVGASYADGAVLGAVAASGAQVPILLSGSGARSFVDLVGDEGLVLEVLDAPAGAATLVKLLRSVYMKGRDALVLEMMLAARRYGLHQVVARSIAGPGEQVPFTALSERVLCSLALHAERRAEELRASGEVVRAAGVEPRITLAGAEVLSGLVELGLRERFAGERPSTGEEVLQLIESLTREAGGTAAG